jgi:Ca-activated chloride channel homolog
MEFQAQVQAQNKTQTTSSDQTISLENVNIIGYMLDNMGKINYEMTFSNTTTQTINPIYYFSLESKATICKFTMLVGTQVLMGEVQEKKQAQRTYNEAQTEGKKTALIEKISDSNYKVSVGNVEPGLRVIVSFDYLVVLELDDDFGFKFNVPTNIGLKYFSTPQTQRDWDDY